MTDTNVFQLSQPGNFADPLTEVLRKGARALLAQAVEAEVATLLSRYADETTDDGRKRLVRHGHLPEREIMTGIGPVGVRCPRGERFLRAIRADRLDERLQAASIPYIVNNQPAMSRKCHIRNPVSRLTQRGSPMTRRSRHPAL